MTPRRRVEMRDRRRALALGNIPEDSCPTRCSWGGNGSDPARQGECRCRSGQGARTFPRRRSTARLEDEDLLSLIRKNPRVLKLLRDSGVHFCAGCYLTLSSTPDRAAAYHGVPDIARFLRQLQNIVAPGSRRKHHRRV